MKKSLLCKSLSLLAALALVSTALYAVAQNEEGKKKRAANPNREARAARVPGGRVPRGAFVDSIKNWNQSFRGPVWEKAFQALEKVNAETPDGVIQVQGDDIRVQISTYSTKAANEAVVESHRDFIDIQMILKGQETFRWWPARALTVTQPYDAVKDIIFYDNKVEPMAELNARPGVFAVFMPGDAHSTQNTPAGAAAQPGRKAVVKIRASLLAQQASQR